MSEEVSLLIDTAFCTHIALYNPSGKVMDNCWRYGTSAGDALVPLVSESLCKNKLAYSDIKEIILGIGPGSFTGLRAGIAFAEGLSMARKIPVYSFSTLQSMLWSLNGKPGAAVIPAKTGWIYLASNTPDTPGFQTERVAAEDLLKESGYKFENLIVPDGWTDTARHFSSSKVFSISRAYHYQRVFVNAKKNIPIVNGVVVPNYVQTPSARRKV